MASYNLLRALCTVAQGGGLAEGFFESGFGLRSASGEVERRRSEASSEAQPERNAAAEPQTEARRSCGTVLMPLVTNAHCASLHGLPVGPVPLSTTPVPLRKPRARRERNSFDSPQ